MDRRPAEQPVIADGRYVVRTLLRSANTVDTYLCESTERRGRPVVVKTLPSDLVPPVDLEFFARGATPFSDDTPCLAPLFDVGIDGGTCFAAAPYVDGVSLGELLASRSLETSEVIALGISLMRGLAELHDVAAAHRAVKPSNVIVPMDDAISGATLVDTLFACTVELPTTIGDSSMDSVRYMSPEQAGLIDHPVDARSDLYSAGIVLYEALTGVTPFDSDTAGGVLRRQLVDSPSSLRRVGVDVPGALDELVLRLLSKLPEDRYQTAEAVRADLEAIASAEQQSQPEGVVLGTHDRRTTLAEPSFVGRAAELRQLRAMLEVAAAGDAQVALVSSVSGGGKSRLIEEFASTISHDTWVLHGQGLDQSARRPFQMFQGIASSILDAVQIEPELAERLREQLGDDADAIVTALPELGELLGVEQVTDGPDEHGEYRSVRGLAHLLRVLGTADRPAVVVLDDCQWADDLTYRTLTSWSNDHERRQAPGGHTLLVAAFRAEEVGAEHPMRALGSATTFELAGLPDLDVRALAESMAGPLPERALDTIVRLSAGSPFMASAVLRGMVEVDALRATRERTWQVDDEAIAHVSSSDRAASFLTQRITLLDADTLLALSIGAVLGKEFDIGFAAHLVDRSTQELRASLAQARERHIVWFEDGGSDAAFTHDKLREAVLADLDPQQRAEWHLRAGALIEAEDPSRVFDLAYHFDAARCPERALPYALEGARIARQQHSLAVAQEHFTIAQRAAEAAPVATRREIAEGLGDTMMLRGRYEDARTQLETALKLATGPIQRSDVLGKLGELQFKQGNIERAEEALESALRELGIRVPSSTWGFLLGALAGTWVQLWHSLLPGRFLARRSLDSDRAHEDRVVARHYSRAAHIYWFGRGTFACAWAHLRGMNSMERYPATPELAQSYSEQAPVMTLVTWYDRGIDYVTRSLEIRRQLGDVWGQGQSMHFHGVVLYGASRFQEAIATLREAIRLLDRTGDRWEVNTATWHVAFCQYRLGNLDAAVETAARVYRSGVEIGDAQARGISLGAWSKASFGQVPAEYVAPELANLGRDVHTSVEVLQAEAIRLLALGDPEPAVEHLVRARSLILRAGVMQEYVAPVFPWLATAKRLAAEAVPAWDPKRRRALLRRAGRMARWARIVGSRYRNNGPHALREAGLIAADRGRLRTARRLLLRSLDRADAIDASHELAMSAAAYVRVGSRFGWSDLETYRAMSQGAVTELGVQRRTGGTGATASLVDRFDQLLDVGRTIAELRTREEVFQGLHDSALTLLRGERAFVIPADSAGEVPPDLERFVQATQQPRVFDGSDQRGSVALDVPRSAIVAPILVRGAIDSRLVVVHHGLDQVYGDDELHIAEFLASITGAALEHADDLERMVQFTEVLEARVDERTAELNQSNSKLRQSNDAMRDFVSTAAHELRTPVTVIVGSASVLQEDSDQLGQPESERLVGAITRQSQRLQGIVDDLLTVSRIESGMQETQREPFDVRDLVEQSIQLTVLDGNVAVDCDSDLRAVGDVEHVERILVNLLANAAKYGEAPFRVDADRVGDGVEIRVVDSGPGVPGAFVPRLFDKFARANTLHDRKTPGSGLGLSIVRGLAELNAGSIRYEPADPTGSCFILRLPLA